MYLLDTNVLSEVRKGERMNSGVRRWWDTADEGALFTSVLVLGEIRRGIELRRRRDPKAAVVLDRWLGQLQAAFAPRILDIDADVADIWGQLGGPDPIPVVDGLLAATALARGFTMVTRNATDFERAGAAVLNPFE